MPTADCSRIARPGDTFCVFPLLAFSATGENASKGNARPDEPPIDRAFAERVLQILPSELHRAVAMAQFADDGAAGDGERGEQAGDAVPRVAINTTKLSRWRL
ncbi:hypothetical protein OG943_10820 [Amycolatopsis sp. NBC_00345]|uniref:hypothetical protein n=1 Tax=Amycolatopsis sp. NBC_00345 TaxID=2975955 RepID=UPI002E256EBF